jgi:CHAT domain-containing protein
MVELAVPLDRRRSVATSTSHQDVNVLHLLLAFGLATINSPSIAQRGDDPRVLVRTAARAVEGDSAPRLRARWTARLSNDSSDRAALFGLATLSRLTYDYPAAESTYRRLFAVAHDRYAVYARLGLGSALEMRSLSREAAPEFERARSAAREVGDHTAEAEALLQLSSIRGRLEGVRVIEQLLDTVALLLPDTVLDLQSALLTRRARALMLRGKAADAVAAAESSLVVARRAQSPRAEGDVFLVMGQLFQSRGQWDSSLVALRRAEEIYRQTRTKNALSASLFWQSVALGTTGRLGEMRAMTKRQLAAGQAVNNQVSVADAHRALGALAEILGDWPGAANHLKRSAAISIAVGDSFGLMQTNKYLAKVALVAGDIGSAKRVTLSLLSWGQRTQDAATQYDMQRSLADIAEREGDTAAVTRALDGARAQLRVLTSPNYRAWLAHDEARHAILRGDLSAAERSLEIYLQASTGPGFDVSRFDARMRLADIYAKRGDLPRAEHELVTATDEIDRWRARLGDTELRTLAFQTAVSIDAATQERGGSAARAARVLGALAAGGRVEVAFALAERWRARELTERLARGAALRSNQLVRTSANALSSTAPRNAADIASALPDERTALLEFVVAEGAPLTVFVVQRSGVRAHVLPPFDSLAQDVARFGSLIESGADAARLGRTLGAALLDPILPLLDLSVTRVIVVPDGPLHRLPFDALRMANGQYVFERYAVGIAPSASAVVALWSRRTRAPAQPLRLLAFGDPSISGAARGVARDAADDDTRDAGETDAGALPRLEGAAREARLVARYAPAGDVRLGDDASAAFLKQADLRPYRVLHFAAHAIVDERSVDGTALALAPGNGENGLVGAGDLAALQLDADLVVLSACRSAGGVLVGGEGVQGLTSPLLQAGARALVATAWRIPDQRVVPFIDTFYGALARGLTVVEALRAAKLSALKNGEPPRTWAAFLAIGDPLVVVPLRTPPAHWWSGIFLRSTETRY